MFSNNEDSVESFPSNAASKLLDQINHMKTAGNYPGISVEESMKKGKDMSDQLE